MAMIRKGVIPLLLAGFVAVAVALILPSMAAAQQSASSPSYFLPGGERAPGGQCASTNFRMEVAVGAGAVAQLSNSTNFKLLGGFNAVSEAPVAGQPWLSGAQPLFGPYPGGTTHYLHGHELNLGAATNVTIGGHAATVVNRWPDRVQVTLPVQSSPGWQPVTAVNAGGTAHLTPRGIGVLPMCETGWAIEIGQPFRVTYRGTPGDIIFVAVATARFPVAIPIPPYNYGFEQNLAALVGLIGPMPVTSPTGELHLDFPAGIPLIRPMYVQMLGLTTGSPGYQPGCFTNTTAL